MQSPRADDDQVKQVFDSATRLLGATEASQSSVTAADIAADTGLDLPLVASALESLATDHLNVEPEPDWERARVQSVEGEFGGWL